MKQIIYIIIFILILLPAITLAKTATSTLSQKQLGQFCATLATKVSNTDQKFAQDITKLDTRRNENLNKIVERRNTVDKKLADARTLSDAKRVGNFDMLRKKANNPVQEVAIKDFQSTVEQLVDSRKTAVNTAFTTYRAGLDSAMATRKTAVDNAVQSYETAVKAALTIALADCATQKDPKDIKNIYTSSLKAAKDQLTKTRNTINTATNTAKATTLTTRKQAIDLAIKDFTSDLVTARATLKTQTKK